MQSEEYKGKGRHLIPQCYKALYPNLFYHVCHSRVRKAYYNILFDQFKVRISCHFQRIQREKLY